jgi:hypothetical protein
MDTTFQEKIYINSLLMQQKIIVVAIFIAKFLDNVLQGQMITIER